MGITIAVVGKGGTGKTTLSALLIQHLSRKGIVLAVDADPSTNLNQALGLTLEDTVGSIREKMDKELKEGTLSPGVTKAEILERQMRGILVESSRVDLLAMGRPEGPGCYCAVNNILRTLIDKLTESYNYVVMDCEAGMEHISRQTTKDIDLMITVSDPTVRSITTAIGMKELISEMRTRTGPVALVINRVAKQLPEDIRKLVEGQGFDPIVEIPEDKDVYDLEVGGRPIIELQDDTPLRQGVADLLSALGLEDVHPAKGQGVA